MTGPRKTRRAVEDALDDDINKIDQAVRRALFAISTEQDEHADKMEEAHEEIMAAVKQSVKRLEKMVTKLQTTLSAIAVSLLVAGASAFLQFFLK